jgi:dUTP pyrophosphatase
MLSILLLVLCYICNPQPTWRITETNNPPLTDGRIAPRSGLASKHMIDTGAGVIDADYRGQVKVLLFNHGDNDFEVKEGDRVAQLVLERIYTPEVMEVQVLEESIRGEGGFGSTG